MKSWERDLDLLSSSKLSLYEDSLEVLRLMRKGSSLTSASNEVGISSNTVQNFVGSALKKVKNRLLPRTRDNLLRKIRIYEGGEEKLIQVRGLSKASKIGKYLSTTSKLAEFNDRKSIQNFTRKRVKDIHGKFHSFETDPDTIFDILDRREEPEFFTIYSTGG